ncbi:Probable inactive poly [ADP-ribose] polymerase SRO2, partial [Linum perenne]
VDEQETISIDDHEILKADSDSDESPGEFNRVGGGDFEVFTRNGFAPLAEDTSHHGTIKKCFLDGLGQRAAGVAVTAIHRNSMSVPNAKARFFSFRAYEKAAAEKYGGGGMAKARYAWYGGSRDEIRQILSFGFSRCSGGVHLSPISFPSDW